MLNIYYGRESVDKEKFIYETIRERGFSAASPVIVLVPDQYTLEAERQAFRILDQDAVIGLDVYSISRLGHNVLSDVGQGEISFIDKYGRQMLLTRILAKLKDKLGVYAGNVRKATFIEMVNDYISGLKQYDVTPEAFESIAEEIRDNDALSLKMKDLCLIYSTYDESIKGKYTDSEDYVDLFVSSASKSELLRRAAVWVYGFDSLAPKSVKVLGKLMQVCPEVNVVLTYDRDSEDEDLFMLTGRVIDNLKAAAKENGAEIGKTVSIAEAFPDGRYQIRHKNKEIMHAEHELFSPAPVQFHGVGESDEGIFITEAANYYNEAETAASHILHLVRDKGYRYRDIAVICNDITGLGAALSRAFDEYGIPCFLDRKRNIAASGVAAYISSIVASCIKGMRTQDIMRALKTGLGILGQEETENLENYAVQFRIDRKLWKRSFSYKGNSYTAEEVSRLEESRRVVMQVLDKLDRIIRTSKTYHDFLTGFYKFLTEDTGLDLKLRQLVDAQNSVGLRDLADETMQIWRMIVNILNQINNILGEEDFDAEEFLQVFTVGLKQAEIGLMPPSPDDLVIGTMQRTRVGCVKSVIVVGADEGILPQAGSQNGLFGEQEEAKLEESGFNAYKTEKVRRQEERLAMYRNFAKPDDELWISYTTSNSEGDPVRPSEIIDDIRRVFPDKKIGRDILNCDDTRELVAGYTSTLRHLTEMMIREKTGAQVDPVWQSVRAWYRSKAPETADAISEGLKFENKADSIGRGMSDMLFSGRDLDALSVSRLETYAKCPFAYFVNYGLKPEERRIFEAGSQEIGNVYHESLMKITRMMTENGLWDTITEEQIDELVASTVREERDSSGGGVFHYSKSDGYRADRAEQTLKDALMILIEHARAGKIKTSRYEEGFGRSCAIRPIEVNLEDKKVYIEGIIDRLDILQNDRVKIIDYKSGEKQLDKTQIESGFMLQLMLYMKAAQEGVKEPAGVFYFHIGTKNTDVADAADVSIAEAAEQEKIDELRDASMRGILINEPETIEEILGDDETGRMASIRKLKSGKYSASHGSMVLEEGEFRDLQDAVDKKVSELIEGIASGNVDIRPLRIKKENKACKFCQYKGICRFDTGFRGCGFNTVK